MDGAETDVTAIARDAEAASGEIPGAAYLLTWNPDRWEWATLKADVAAVREGRSPEDAASSRWSCGNNRRIKPGSRLFLVKQGAQPRGIIGSAWATSDVFEQAHWDAERARRGDKARFVTVRFETLIDPAAVPPLDPQDLSGDLAHGVHWGTQSSGIAIDANLVPRLEQAWREYLSASARADSPSGADDFLGVLRRYQQDRTVFQSTTLGHRYYVREVTEDRCEVHRVDASEPETCTLAWYEDRVRQMRDLGGSMRLNDVDGTVAKRITFLQSARFGLSPDRRQVLELADPRKALENFCAVVRGLDVDRSSGTPKLYKPILVAIVIEGIEAGALSSNRVSFDWAVPRFLERAKTLGVEATVEQAAMAFYHLTGDQFWLLCYVNLSELVDGDTLSPGTIRQRVSHAIIKDTYWRLLQVPPYRRRALRALKEQWWPSVEPPLAGTPPGTSGFWWVNQGRTYDQERKLGLIWAPQRNEQGATFFHWTNVLRVRAGDLLFSYADGAIRSVAIATSDGHEAPRPQELPENAWGKDGWAASLEYYDLSSSIPLAAVGEKIARLSLQRGPVNAAGSVNQAYLFELTADAARIISAEVDLASLPESVAERLRELLAQRPKGNGEPSVPAYAVDEALAGLFIPPEDFLSLLAAWRRKKNAILQGPPGVGKTFVARRLAYALMGVKDPSRVEMVQFHQSYAYEDFVQGWRPEEGGGFTLRNGVFYEFCRRAAADGRGVPYVFIIDEINRGNVSRILGELMLLIESDHRGEASAIPLTYAKDATDRFWVPETVYLLGMMNTADRSLAMVDYALRRRFCFAQLRPAFGTAEFRAFLSGRVDDALIDRIVDRMSRLNEQVAQDKNLGKGFEIGHSFFCPGEGDTALDDSWYAMVIQREIAPLVREYWFDDLDKADELIADLLR